MKVDSMDLSLDDLGADTPQIGEGFGQEVKQEKCYDEMMHRELGQKEEGRGGGGQRLHRGHGVFLVRCGIVAVFLLQK